MERLAGFGYDKLNQYYITNYDENMSMSEIIRVTVYCNFDFSYFPFDHQHCNLSLIDPVYSKNWVVINETKFLCNKGICQKGKEWIMLQNQNKIPYSIRMKNMGSHDLTFGTDIDPLAIEPWSFSSISFSLQRNTLGLLIGSFYFPTGLFALLSMGSYLINPEIVSTMTLNTYACFKINSCNIL